MDSVLQSINKPFTRYFMPGLVFTFFSILLPSYIFYPELITNSFNLLTYGNVITLSLVLGYLLDSGGFYKWTLHYKSYQKEKKDFAGKLKDQTENPETTSDDPDIYISKLWVTNEHNYNRIMNERAEWVLVLETAFALMFSSIILLSLCFVHFSDIKIILFILPILFSALSYIISKKGLQRMKAHNSKLAYSLSKGSQQGDGAEEKE